MPSTSKTIESSTAAFAKDITKFLTDKRGAKIKALQDAAAKEKKKGAKDAPEKDAEKSKDKPKDFGAKLVTATFVLSKRAITQNRTPETQAELISNGKSWTPASAHVIDMARHVDLMYGPPGKTAKLSWDLKGAFGSGEEHFATLSELKTKWNALMKTHDLKNFAGKDGWSDKDSFHFEIAESKVPRGDPKIDKCLAHYAKLTRIDGRSKNTKFENGTWKSTLAPHLKKIEDAKKKAEEEKRKAELAKLTFSGALKSSQTLLKNANKSTSGAGKPLAGILPETEEDTGKVTRKPISLQAPLVWDSLARSIFETLGLAETKGFDIKLLCEVSYDLVTHQYLSQSFVDRLKVSCAVIYNTPAAFAMKMSVKTKTDLALAKSAKGVSGTVVFDVVLANPIDKESATVTMTFKDGKVSATAKHG